MLWKWYAIFIEGSKFFCWSLKQDTEGSVWAWHRQIQHFYLRIIKKIYKSRKSRYSQQSDRLIHEQCSLNSNDEVLSLGVHIPIGTLNIVAFWQTACQNWSVHREGTGASRKCSEAALSSGDEICSMSWKAAQLQGQASVWAQWLPGLLLSSRTFNIVVDKSVTQN